jgi:hypothetical protein
MLYDADPVPFVQCALHDGIIVCDAAAQPGWLAAMDQLAHEEVWVR